MKLKDILLKEYTENQTVTSLINQSDLADKQEAIDYLSNALPQNIAASPNKLTPIIQDFIQFYKANPSSSMEISFVASLLKMTQGIKSLPNYDLKSFQKMVYDKLDIVYIDLGDLDILTPEQVLTQHAPSVAISKEKNNSWDVVSMHGGYNRAVVKLNPETGELTVSGSHTTNFHDFMAEIGEQGAEALISDIKSKYPNALTENKVALFKLLFNN